MGDWGAKQEAKWIGDWLDIMGKYWSDFDWFKRGLFSIFMFVTNFFEKFYLTTLAGFDWMSSTMVNLRRIERDTTEEVMKEYCERMDQLLSIDSGMQYQEWVHEEWRRVTMRKPESLREACA